MFSLLNKKKIVSIVFLLSLSTILIYAGFKFLLDSKPFKVSLDSEAAGYSINWQSQDNFYSFINDLSNEKIHFFDTETGKYQQVSKIELLLTNYLQPQLKMSIAIDGEKVPIASSKYVHEDSVLKITIGIPENNHGLLSENIDRIFSFQLLRTLYFLSPSGVNANSYEAERDINLSINNSPQKQETRGINETDFVAIYNKYFQTSEPFHIK